MGTLIAAFNGMGIRFAEVPEAAIFSCITFFLFTIGLEIAQRLQSTDPAYLNKKWLDSLVDIITGNAGYNAVFWLILLWGGWYLHA